MFKVAKSFEYAILALKYMEENGAKKYITAKEISEKVNIPYELLAKILQYLVRRELIKSIQGIRGGYRMERKSEDIPLAEIMLALNKNIQITDCLFDGATEDDCKRLNDCPIREPLSNIQKKIDDIFNKITLKEIIK